MAPSMKTLAVAAMLLGALRTSCQAPSMTSADLCCTALSTSRISAQVSFPGSPAYDEFLHSFFAANAQLPPTCIVRPLTTEDVAVAVRTLNPINPAVEPCMFAIHSGGHSPVPGAASISPGVTIDLSLMNRTTYHLTTQTVSIQPGARWGSVYETLQPHGVIVPGGRTPSVGVGGYLLGGGYSFFAPRVGLACDSVLSFEVVLASGEVVTASQRSHPDLFRALRGGSSNFGIVTLYTMATLRCGEIWAGYTLYDASVMDQFISAAVRFTDNIDNDPYAAWVGLLAYRSATDQTVITSAFPYTRPVAWPDAYRDFYQIPNLTDTLQMTTVLAVTKSEVVSAAGNRYTTQTGTYLNREAVLHQLSEILAAQIREARQRAQGSDFEITFLVQPWVPAIWRDTKSRGGNVLGLDRFNETMLNIEFQYNWADGVDDPLFTTLATSARAELNEYARSIGAYNECVYMNYAGGGQNPLAGYGRDNVAFMRRVARRYDPHGVFQELVPGGFKLSKV
ncbi:FAD-binding domain-containing protein [Aspergillus carlsbadensis]|nr:FAD-binding domain-containing protein [Aspergillus carlsbadensis]